MVIRRLTGRWYLKKGLFGYIVMVESIQTSIYEFDFSRSTKIVVWEKAKKGDFIDLGINIG